MTTEEKVKYRSSADASVEFHGVLVKTGDAQGTPKRPAVIVFHEWWGLNAHSIHRAHMLADSGKCIALCADVYGEGKTTTHPGDAGEMVKSLRTDRTKLRLHAAAAVDYLLTRADVDASKIAAIGFCFGGYTALELALGGAPIVAAGSFHGSIPALASKEDAAKCKARLLICHGALDSFVPEDSCKAFRTFADEAKVDYQFIYYSGTYHSFTVVDAAKHGMKGLEYNEFADKRSAKHLQLLLDEVF